MHILTFDIEDWYCHDDYSRDFNWDKHEVRIYQTTELILDSLKQYNISATFFCLGWIAQKHPAVVKSIANAGHHIGCHSYQHELATRFTPKQFRADTMYAKALIEDFTGKEVNAYRVPSFSFTKSNTYNFEILAELGFKYDCSVFPTVHEFGGFPGCKFINTPLMINTASGSIKEFPVSLGYLLGKKIVYAGGGYFRILPYVLSKYLASNSPYVMSYFHPSDFDPDQPNMPHLSLLRQFKNRVCLKGCYKKFQRFIADFDFHNIESADKEVDWSSVPKITC